MLVSKRRIRYNGSDLRRRALTRPTHKRECSVSSQLLVTKIIPPTRQRDLLRRQRLLDFLHAYLDRKLLLVSASAGYGKTSLLVDFVQDTELPVCWYSLDAADSDPRVFLEYLVASLQRRFPHFGKRITALLPQTEPTQNLDMLVGVLVTEIQQSIDEFFVLVLDDYQLVEANPAVNRLLDRLLLYLPAHAHLILASRTVPTGLTLTRLTARQEVAGLGVGDLRFTADEIRALLETKYGLEITPETAAELAQQSEGWITGLILTTPTLWRGVFQEWVKTAGPGSQLFDYLAAEVLGQQTPALQQFLLDTSVLSEMDPALCNELLGRTDAAPQLLTAEKRNLFLARLGDLGYRYHHLFQQFLETRLRETQPARWRALQERAAALCERHGKMDRAIAHWFTAANPPQAARVIALIADEYFARGKWTTLARWLDTLPRAALDAEPALLLCQAMLRAATGAPAEADSLFDAARAKFEACGDTLNVVRALLESARYAPDATQVRARCERALERAPAQELGLRARAYHTLGIGLTRHGSYAAAAEPLQRAVELAILANQSALQADAEHDLGNLYVILGDRRRAQRHLENALKQTSPPEPPAKRANTLNTIAILLYQRGELERAAELLNEALAEVRNTGHLRTEAYVLASLGEVERDRGHRVEALDYFGASYELAEKIHEPLLLSFTRVASGDLWRASGDWATAERVLEAALQTAMGQRADYPLALVQLALGALKLAQHDTDAAKHHLEHAARVFQAAGEMRQFGRAQFYLARLALHEKQEPLAVEYLRKLAALGRSLEEDQFLHQDLDGARPLLEFALKRRIAPTFYRRLLNAAAQVAATERALLALKQETRARLDVFILGSAEVYVNGILLNRSAWQTAKTKELFFFFVTHPQGWRKEEIIETVWGDISQAQGNDSFHSNVYRLRRALFPEAIVFQHGLYQFNPEIVCTLDARQFETALDEALQTDDLAQKRAALECALAWYRGDYLPEIYSDWCAARREHLRARFLDALATLAQCCVDLQDHAQALKVCQELLRHDPLREATYRDLMMLYVKLGERAAALQTYYLCVERLQSGLGVAPMPETEALFRELKAR